MEREKHEGGVQHKLLRHTRSPTLSRSGPASPNRPHPFVGRFVSL